MEDGRLNLKFKLLTVLSNCNQIISIISETESKTFQTILYNTKNTE